MQGLIRRILRIVFDPRIIVGIIGATLSIVMHEAFHIIIHWGEIQSINIFPDHNAIVEIFFVPSTNDVDLAFEEATAYLITIITLVLTVMLISDIHEALDRRSVQQIIFKGKGGGRYTAAQKRKSDDHLARLLGVKPATRKASVGSRKR